MQEACDYPAIVEVYATFMIEQGRDSYGKVHSPLFVSVMDRKTARVFANMKEVPYPHVITRPAFLGRGRRHRPALGLSQRRHFESAITKL